MRILLIKAWLSEDWIARKRVTKPNYAVHCSSLEFIGVHYNLDRVQTTAILPMTLHTVDAQKIRNRKKQLVTQFLRQNCGVMIRNHGR
jgi:hypothetical protein